MATTTAFGSLAVPPTNDDTMEMSSPGHRGFGDGNDDDIDIDFEDYATGPQDSGTTTTTTAAGTAADDEHMFEDEERPGTAGDEVMSDELQPQTTEQVMQDGDAQLEQVSQLQQEQEQEQEQDEDLLDYSEEEEAIAQESTITQQPVISDQSAQAAAVADEAVSALPETAATIDSTAVGQAAELQTHEADDHLPPESDDIEELPAPSQEAAAQVEGEANQDYTEEEGQDLFETKDHESSLATGGEHAASEDHTEVVEEADPTSLAIDTAQGPLEERGPETPTDTGLHPMTLRYGEMYMPLFKSRNQPDGLLKDDNLASVSLAELIKNCRSRLALKRGEVISEDQELILGFDTLGLYLVEDSRSSFETSLNEVIDVYLLLHYNEQFDEVAPLSLTVSLQLKFSSMFTTLKRASENGQGISSFSFLDSHEVAEEEWDDEQYEDDGTNQETAAGAVEAGEHHHEGQEEYDDTTHVENVEEGEGYEGQKYEEAEYGQDAAEHTDDHYDDQQHENAAYEEHDEQYAQLQDGEGEVQAEPKDESLETHAEALEEQPSAEASYNAPEDPTQSAASRSAALGETSAQSLSTVTETSPQSHAQGTSVDTTEIPNNTTTNDNDDDNDKPIDSFTTSTLNGSDQNGSSALVQHSDVEEKAAADDTTATGDQQAGTLSQAVASEPQDSQAAQQSGDLEEELNYDAAADDDAEHTIEQNDAPHDEYQDQAEYPAQTDENGEQQHDYTASYQPADGEEEFHTGIEFLEDEHGEGDETFHDETELQQTHEYNFDEPAADVGEASATAPAAEGDDYVDFGDDIGFDDEEPVTTTNGVTSQTNAHDATDAAGKTTASSPSGKRSFDQHADNDGDLLEDGSEQPESKKVRQS